MLLKQSDSDPIYHGSSGDCFFVGRFLEGGLICGASKKNSNQKEQNLCDFLEFSLKFCPSAALSALVTYSKPIHLKVQ